MADPVHVEIVRQGSRSINEWRINNESVQLNLSCADLPGADLSGADLSGADLNNADLNCADLNGADLSSAQVCGANLCGANLYGANLRGSNLRGARFYFTNLGEANLSGAHLSEAYLQQTNLKNANLSSAYLISAKLEHCDLRSANLSNAVLVRTKVSDTDLSGADLSGAGLTYTIFARSNLTESIFHGAKAAHATFGATDLSNSIGLESMSHYGPSTVGIDTLYKSRGLIPDDFLIGCGIPEPMITYFRSLIEAQSPLQLKFYSCFISYCQKDEAFCKQLHRRMREAGLRVWFAPEDMKGGDKIQPQVEKALHEQDKLLVVLSEESMNSNWVKHEIKQSHKRAVAEQRNVLFPIRMVPYDAVLKWSEFDHSAAVDIADEIRSYHILDFSGWENPEQFEKAFQKLLVDLRKVEPPKI